MSTMTPYRTLGEAVQEFCFISAEFRDYPLQLRIAFLRIFSWLPDRDAALSLEAVTASTARMIRDRACRERGWRFANQALTMVQIIVARGVDSGVLHKNRVRQIPKILPPRR